MKINKYLSAYIIGLFCLSSCYDDSSTLATQNIGNVSFDDSNSPELYIGYQEELNISPSIKMESGTNSEALTYEWKLTETDASYNNEYETIATEKNLKYVMERPISSAPYTLALTITDKDHKNLQYIHSWNIYVQSSFLDGILISDTKDGKNSDLTLISNQAFSVNYNKDEHVFRNILETANKKPYDGLLQSLTYELQGTVGSTHTNQIWAITDQGACVRFNCVDYSQNGQYEDETLFINKTADAKVYSFMKSYQDFYAYTSNGIYSITPTTSNRFGSPRNDFKSYQINNNVMAYSPNTSYSSSSLISYSDNHLNFYDKNKGAFVTCSGFGQFMSIGSYEANLSFDPNNLPGQTAIAAVVYEDVTQSVFLLKDDTSGAYSIYTLSTHSSEDGYYTDPDNWEGWVVTTPEQLASAKNKYSIPNEGKSILDKAISVFFSNKNLVLYVATADGIYTINYGSGTNASVSTVAKFTPESGEKITLAKMFQQGIYKHDLGLIVGNDASVSKLEWSNNAIMIATQKGEYEGKIYVVPITQSAVGTLDKSKAKIYEGFGKILDVTTTGY